MTIADLKKSMDARFGEHDTQFAAIDKRFDAIDARFAAVDARFDGIDARFDRLDARIVASEETTRRHFDIVAEQLRADMKLVIDKLTSMNDQISGATATNAREHGGFVHVLDDHEVRIKALERKSS